MSIKKGRLTYAQQQTVNSGTMDCVRDEPVGSDTKVSFGSPKHNGGLP